MLRTRAQNSRHRYRCAINLNSTMTTGSMGTNMQYLLYPTVWCTWTRTSAGTLFESEMTDSRGCPPRFTAQSYRTLSRCINRFSDVKTIPWLADYEQLIEQCSMDNALNNAMSRIRIDTGYHFIQCSFSLCNEYAIFHGLCVPIVFTYC